MEGSYCCVEPALDMSWQYAGWGARLGYTHSYDLKQGWDRGYGEFELSRDIVDAGVKLVLLYRKGRTAPLFENERTLIFGIGISR